MNVESIGSEARKSFIQECVDNPNQFKERIKKSKIHCSAAESGKRKIRGAEGKIIEATLIKDLFGSILCLSMQQKIDIAEILKYPLKLVPLCLSHVDDSINSAPKSILLNYIDSQFVTVPPSSIDTTMIDAVFFLHWQIYPLGTFGGIARSVLNEIIGYSGNVIHFVADKRLTPSIKDIEHTDRDTVSTTYKIMGPSQERPTDWTVTLKNFSFKESLIDFFVKSWKDDSLAPFFNGKVLYANSQYTCYKFEPQDNKVLCTEQVNYCNHEEADSRMFYHLSLIVTPSNVVMRTIDTDSLIIAMGCKKFYETSLKLWLEVGTQSKNTIKYISIDQSCEKFWFIIMQCVTSFSYLLYKVWLYRVI